MNSAFTLVELAQGTNEWLSWRRSGIGSSDAPTVMGENPYKSVEELLKEKLAPIEMSDEGSTVRRNPGSAMARGTQLEPEARRRYILQTGKSVEPACLQSTKHEWLRASLDGFSVSPNVVLEIKCGQSVYWKTSRSRTVPVYYYGQLQHLLAVTGYDALDFYCYWPGCPEVLLEVQRNESYIERLLDAEFEFWNRMQAGC